MDDPILVEGSAANEEAIAEAVSNFEILWLLSFHEFFLTFFAVFYNKLFLVCTLVVLKTLSSIFCQ